MVDFRRTIRGELKRRGWTRYQLAKASDVDESSLGRFLSGASELRSDNLARLLNALKLELKRKGQ